MQTSTKIPERTTTRSTAPVREHVRADQPVVASPPRRRLSGWGVAAVVFVALVGLASALMVINGPAETPEVAVATISGPAVGSQEFLYKLAEQGYIPMASVDMDRLLLERLVTSGDIPAASLQPSQALIDAIYTPYEQLLLDAVESGHVPAETLDTDTFREKELLLRRGETLEALP
jgi:hypothetical protein